MSAYLLVNLKRMPARRVDMEERIFSMLEGQGLIGCDGDRLHLTAVGRAYLDDSLVRTNREQAAADAIRREDIAGFSRAYGIAPETAGNLFNEVQGLLDVARRGARFRDPSCYYVLQRAFMTSSDMQLYHVSGPPLGFPTLLAAERYASRLTSGNPICATSEDGTNLVLDDAITQYLRRTLL